MQSRGEHEMPTVQQKCIMLGNAKCEPFVGNTSAKGSQNANHPAEIQSFGEHEIPTIQQKCIMIGNTKREPPVGNSVTQNVNRPAEIQSSGQPSRIRKSSIPYHSDMVAGRGLAEEDDFEVVSGATIDADAYLG